MTLGFACAECGRNTYDHSPKLYQATFMLRLPERWNGYRFGVYGTTIAVCDRDIAKTPKDKIKKWTDFREMRNLKGHDDNTILYGAIESERFHNIERLIRDCESYIEVEKEDKSFLSECPGFFKAKLKRYLNEEKKSEYEEHLYVNTVSSILGEFHDLHDFQDYNYMSLDLFKKCFPKIYESLKKLFLKDKIFYVFPRNHIECSDIWRNSVYEIYSQWKKIPRKVTNLLFEKEKEILK